MDRFPDLSTLTHEQKDELIGSLLGWVEKLRARVAELEARLSKDSHNSSKSPSSDGYAKKTRSFRVASGCEAGWPKGAHWEDAGTGRGARGGRMALLAGGVRPVRRAAACAQRDTGR